MQQQQRTAHRISTHQSKTLQALSDEKVCCVCRGKTQIHEGATLRFRAKKKPLIVLGSIMATVVICLNPKCRHIRAGEVNSDLWGLTRRLLEKREYDVVYGEKVVKVVKTTPYAKPRRTVPQRS